MALGANAFDDVFHLMSLEAFREGDEGNGVVFKAISLATLGAGKMDVVEVVMTFAAADAVFEDA